MRKVNSPVEMENILYKVKPDGIADVWLRANQKIVPETEEKSRSYEADEIFCRVIADEISEEEIKSDFDFWFEQLKTEDDGASADKLSIANFAMNKKEELSKVCESTIYAGVDVELSTGTEHFSLTVKDQINLFGKQAQLLTGAERLEYHNDGQPCKYYSADDMMTIITATMQFVSYHTTYCNSLFVWLKGCTKASEMAEITYGAAVPVEYRSIVLNDYLKA